MKKAIALSGLVAMTLFASSPGQAALVDAPVPTNAYILFDGLDWAWANPLPAEQGLDLSYQSQFGWRLPTAAELTGSPLATDFLFDGANVPFNGSDAVGNHFEATNSAYTGAGACAAAYFSSFNHCDWQDGKGQPFGPWAGEPGAASFADQLVVRVSAVPLPASAPMFGAALIGLAGLSYAAKRKKAAAAA